MFFFNNNFKTSDYRGAGCSRLEVLQGAELGLNEHSQDYYYDYHYYYYYYYEQ